MGEDIRSVLKTPSVCFAGCREMLQSIPHFCRRGRAGVLELYP